MLKNGLIVGFINLVVGIVLNQLSGIVFPSIAIEYQNPAIFRPWSDPLMMIYFAYPFIAGFVFYYLWTKVNLKGRGTERAINFAKLYFIVATIPGMFITYTSFQLSLLMILIWSITGFVQAFVAGLLFDRMVK